MFRTAFRRALEARAIEATRTAACQPWQSVRCERVISALRRECTDHLVIFSERHLLRCLREYVAYYNTSRTHQSLGGDAPVSRPTECEPAFELITEPVLGGLHNRYRRAG